jgi:uncharacterized protein (TIGR01777 family)
MNHPIDMPTFTRRTRLPVPAQVAFDWHLRPGAFHRLTPGWEQVEPISIPATLEEGARAEFDVWIGPLRWRWVAEHRNFEPGRQFQDVQVQGPFAVWEHTHTIEPDGDDACFLEDRIQYELPLGWLGRTFGRRSVDRRLERTFEYRHQLTDYDISAHWKVREQKQMKILVSGSTGMVGSALVPFLTSGGHEVARLVRSTPSADRGDVAWNPSQGTIDAAGLADVDAVVHLAGENIAAGRWNAKQKARIRDSRVDGTKLLCETLAAMDNPPKTLVCASAIGFYGDRGDDVLDEDSDPGSSFLCDVCREWEAACEPARQCGIRVVKLRIGVILSPAGGALAKMLLPFKLGAGGIVGNGRQYWSWISLDDVVGAIHHALTNDDVSGPVNGVAPNPVTNREFTKSLGSVLRRPTIFPMPAFAARLALGEMADELLLASTRVEPKRLLETGFEFRHADLTTALKHVLGK